MRLIDADALADNLGEMWGIPRDWDGNIDETCEEAFDAIENAPTVDAVPVVRCKDCLYSRPYGELLPNTLLCNTYQCLRRPYDYCSDAVRRVEDG